MKIKYLLTMLVFLIQFGFTCYAAEPEDGGTWTYVSASIPYELEGIQVPPETAVLTLLDDLSGMEYEREVPLKKVTEKEQVWTDGFSFPITISGYDADVFLLGELEIPADADLAKYGEALLKEANLPVEYYRVTSVDWIGECYEENGVLYRDAVANGEKLIRHVEVFYGGQVKVPQRPVEVLEEAKQKQEETARDEIVQEIQEPEETEVEVILSEPLEERERSLFEQLKEWVREHLTIVTISIGVILLVVGLAIFFFYERKKSRD